MSHWQQHVHPHGPLRALAKNLYCVQGSLPKGHMTRNMVVYVTDAGEVIFHSPVALNEATQKQIEELGTPTLAIVPNPFHRLDGAVYRERYPKMKIICPAAIVKKVSEKVEVDDNCEKLLPQFNIRVIAPPGIKPLELCFEFPLQEGGYALVVTDILFNLPHLPGLDGLLIKWIGSSGFFGMTRIGRWLLLQNTTSFAQWLGQQAERHDLKMVVPAHGSPITRDIGSSLSAAMQRLL